MTTILYCKLCGSKFLVPKCRDTAKYCSNSCRIKAQNTELNIQRKRKLLQCKQCNKSFFINNYLKAKFCSRLCYWMFRRNNPNIKIQSNQDKQLINKKCSHCGNAYKVWPYRSNSSFCSSTCFNEFRKITLICATCGKYFDVPKHVAKGGRKYCSERCSALGGNKRKSKFSQDVTEFLKQFYFIKTEVVIKDERKKYFADIVIDNILVVECNGDYWHCNPQIYPKDYFNKKLKTSANETWYLDEVRKKFITTKGFRFLTVWEYDWNNDKNFYTKLRNDIENELC